MRDNFIEDAVRRRQTSVIIEARPKVLLGAAVFIFYMGVKVGRANQGVIEAALKKTDNARFEEKYRPKN